MMKMATILMLTMLVMDCSITGGRAFFLRDHESSGNNDNDDDVMAMVLM